jgi:hypothetical protein
LTSSRSRTTPTRLRSWTRSRNINGSFGSGTGFLQGAPGEWAQQLAELTLEQGMSGYILSVRSDDEVRRFAEEVAPAVPELVETERGRIEPVPDATVAADAVQAPATFSFAVTPTPDDGTRLSDERPWDETARPTGPEPDPKRRFSADQQAAGQHLIDVHNGLRSELQRLREVIKQLATGTTNATAVRALFNRMTIRQNNWTLGTFCESYCSAVSGHHSLEDASIFPHLKQTDGRLTAVLGRLGEEHEVIAEILDRIDAMVSHLSYEERVLVEPLARLGYY